MAGKPKRKITNLRSATENKAAEEYATNKILAVFMLTFVILFVLVIAYRGYSRVGSYLTSYYASWVVFWVSAAATVVLGLAALLRREKEARVQKIFTPAHLCFACAMLTVASFASARFGTDGIKVMYAAVPAVSVLVLITMIYPRDFFFIALVSGCGILAMYIYYRHISELLVWQRDFSARSFGATVFILACVAAWTVLLGVLRRNGGVLSIRGREFELYPKNAQWVFSYLTAGVVALCCIVAYVLGSVAAYYMMFLLLAYLFAMAVAYTVKIL